VVGWGRDGHGMGRMEDRGKEIWGVGWRRGRGARSECRPGRMRPYLDSSDLVRLYDSESEGGWKMGLEDQRQVSLSM
jgi:hypothetical protein